MFGFFRESKKTKNPDENASVCHLLSSTGIGYQASDNNGQGGYYKVLTLHLEILLRVQEYYFLTDADPRQYITESFSQRGSSQISFCNALRVSQLINLRCEMSGLELFTNYCHQTAAT